MTDDCKFIGGSYINHRQSRRQTITTDPFGSLYDWCADLLRFILTLLCGGCNQIATKRISKTAAITSISETQRATRSNVWSKLSLIALVIIMTQLLAACQVDAMTLRPRLLKKRHSIVNAASAVDWENPCGGVFEGTFSGERKQKRASLNLLRKAVRDTYKTLNATSEEAIQTSDIKTWFSYNDTYKFMPKLRQNSSVALKRWYRSMQTFVAAFSYLHTQQRHFDEIKLNHKESEISKELKTLLYDARNILCEIESTINHTTSHNREKKLNSFSLEAMNRRLRFRTKSRKEPNLYHIDDLDLKFAKYYFMDFLVKMWEILKTPGKAINMTSSSRSVSVSDSFANSRSVSSNEVIPHRRRLGKKKRPARKQNPNRQRPRPRKNNLSIA